MAMNERRRQWPYLEGELMAVGFAEALDHFAVDAQTQHLVADPVVVSDRVRLGFEHLLRHRLSFSICLHTKNKNFKSGPKFMRNQNTRSEDEFESDE